MSQKPCLRHLLKKDKFPKLDGDKEEEKELEELQLKMLRIQQGIWHQKRRALVLFEGFDAAGKGGAIRRLTEKLDPRGFRVHPIGPPSIDERGQHYLQRFWDNLPSPGTIAIFDRSWYGRVLVERVEKLTPESRWKDAYKEIIEFETTLMDDGIDLVKIFLAISKKEQLKRFEERLNDPYKQWKLTPDDVKARARWDDYVEAADDMFTKTSTKKSPWNLIPADSKHFARREVLLLVTRDFKKHGAWMESQVVEKRVKTLEKALKELGSQGRGFR